MKNLQIMEGIIQRGRRLTEVDNTLLDLQNSSYPTQPHSIIIIAKYCLVRPHVQLKEKNKDGLM